MDLTAFWVGRVCILIYRRVVAMNEFKKDVFVGLVSFSGILSFIFGQFIISTMLFGIAALSSNMLLESRAKLERF
ncbi:hypothetical protein ACH518_09065 [Methylomonas sp. HW2-6]|uniref:hypothetical protein n=1 Tax=Methylomonas sp. HW2-6 TaxID=3376687 RepID=UPI0040432B46